MLKSLNIENIAVIEKADIEFSSGLNAMTGETGAGKSIIVDSINAILGERTSKELVRNGADSASVTALFDDINKNVISKLAELGIACEEDSSLLLSRKISSQGKSTCRINGVPCTVSMLKEIGETLVNIHGQHDSQALLNPDYHIRFIDMMSNDEAVYTNYKDSFKELLSVRKMLKALTVDADTKDRKLEMLSYQIDELQKADIKLGEIEELKARRELVLNSQNLINTLNSALNSLVGSEDNFGVQTTLLTSAKEIEAIKELDCDTKAISLLLDSINEKVEELKDLLSNKLSSIDFSPNELEKIEERLDLFYEFQNKYGKTERDMLNYLANAENERNSIVNSDAEIEKLSVEYDRLLDKTIRLADILSCYRKSLAYQLEQDIKAELEYLDMPKVKFVVNFEKGKLSSNGYDKIEFLISTNAGEPPKPLSKIASGGELSRIMLAIKNIFAKNDSIQTLIFDEIDTGVSGRASRKIGLKLNSVSKHTQVICVTHSAQIASCADNHLLIEKQVKDDRTYTSVSSLDHDGRIKELARIMGGIEITDALIQSAEELLIL